MSAPPSVPGTAMTAPAPFRTAILFDDTDAAMAARAAGIRDGLDPMWFAPELWPARGDAAAARVRLIGRLRSRRPAVLYVMSSSGMSWVAALGLLSGIAVVTEKPSTGLARLARLVRGRYAAASSAASEATAGAPALPPAADALQPILLDLLQMGSSWTTTADRRLPLELMLDAGAGAPDAADRIEERGIGRPDRSVRFVARPSVTVFLPDRQVASGTAVIICPGGGYAGVTIDKEGYDVARWLASRGIAGIVLKYRLPQVERTGAALPWPMNDLAKALALTRAHAVEWGLRSDRIGVMGFSAGGHMAAWASRSAAPPSFAILVYPVISMEQALTHAGSRKALLGKAPAAEMVERYSFERGATAGICPTFVVHARDDTVARPENSFVYLEALRAANAAVEAEIYDRGGHGFGLGRHGGEVANWPARCLNWIAGTTAAQSEIRGEDRTPRAALDRSEGP